MTDPRTMTDISDTLEEELKGTLEENIAKTGWVARQALKIKAALENDREGERYTGRNILKKTYYGSIHAINKIPAGRAAFDIVFTYRFAACLTGYDQAIYARLHGKGLTAKKMTIKNATVVTAIYAAANYSLSELIGDIPDAQNITNIITFFGEKGLSAQAQIQVAWGAYRTIYAMTTNKGLEPIGIESLAYNAHTYMKRIHRWATRHAEKRFATSSRDIL